MVSGAISLRSDAAYMNSVSPLSPLFHLRNTKGGEAASVAGPNLAKGMHKPEYRLALRTPEAAGRTRQRRLKSQMGLS